MIILISYYKDLYNRPIVNAVFRANKTAATQKQFTAAHANSVTKQIWRNHSPRQLHRNVISPLISISW